MKVKTTKKEVLNAYKTVISVEYCNLQYLLNGIEPQAYTLKTNGIRTDVYDFGYVAITTGNSPFGNVKASFELCKKYESLAEDKSIDDRKVLISSFIVELLISNKLKDMEEVLTH